MADTLGRISGQLLKADLSRDGQPLNFENGLLYLNTANRYVGVNEASPFRNLFVNGTTNTSDLISTDGLAGLTSLLISVSGNSITAADDLNLSAANYVFANIVTTDDLELANNTISALTENASIGLEPSGTGTLEVHSDVNVLNSNSLYAQGNITLSGNLIIGNAPTDTITFSANVNSNIVPNLTDTHSLGSNNSTGGNEWQGVWPLLLNGETISTTGIGIGTANLALRPGNVLYVAASGSNTNEGDHQNAPYATIKHALLQAQSGDVVYIYPGTYTEITPLTVPAGVHVKGMGIRSVTIIPDATTNNKDVFLLNGETTVSDISIKDFYYDSVGNTGYAFRFASGMRVYTRSPYVQNISVITSETTPGALDAGRGALVDGSVANTLTKEASMLFHSVTFITPNANGLTMTNGVRVEWLNSFTYFNNIGLYALNGTGRYDANTLTTRYGAELRSISSANVYGNIGAQVEGSSCLMYLINHNFAYIGAGTDVTNDPSLNNSTNETLEYSGGKIYYQSLDNKGNFHVGDAFRVSFDTGNATIGGVATSASGTTSINFTSATSETLINAELVSTGTIAFNNNTISSYVDEINLVAATNEMTLFQDVYVTRNITVVNDFNIEGALILGNQPIDVIEFEADVDYDLRPSTTNTYNLGSLAKKWLSAKVIELDIGTTLKISGHTVESLTAGIDLELIPNGTGKVTISSNTVVENDLTVSANTALKTTNITGVVDLIGAVNRTGDINQTGNTVINGSSVVAGFDVITGFWGQSGVLLTSDDDSTKTITVDVSLAGAITVVSITFGSPSGIYRSFGGTRWIFIQTGTLDVSSTAELDNVRISTNTISTITAGTDLKLIAAGIGEIYVPSDNVLVSQDVTVDDTVHAGSVTVNGTTTANKFDNGDITIEDNIIQTTVGNNNLELGAATTGLVRADLDSVEITQNLTVLLDTNLKNTVIGIGGLTPTLSTLDLTGDYIQVGDVTLQTGNRNISSTLDVDSNAYFEDISIVNNVLSTTTTDTDLSLQAAGSGIIDIDDNATFNQNLRVNSTTYTNGITNSGTISSDVFSDNDIEISTNTITTTVSNNNLRLLAAGVGIVFVPNDAVEIEQDLTVNGSTILQSTVIGTGGLTPVPKILNLTGDYLQTGSTLQTGNRSISTTLDVDSSAYFDDIAFITNRVITDTADTDLSLKAAGTGKVVFNDNVTFSQAATIGTLVTNGLTNSGTITSDFFTNNNIEINDNYITTIVGDDNLILSGISTGGPKLEKVKFNGTTISTETVNEGIIFATPTSNLVISGTNALRVPVGTTTDRTTLTQGEFRFNTTDSLFRGFSTATVSFSGVYSANKLTNVLTHPTNNTLIFTTNSATAMTMSTSGITVSRLDTDNNLSISGNTISTLTTNSNIVLTPNGTGEVIMDDLSFGVSELTNLNASTPIIFQNLGTGYVEFAGTAGITLPKGDNDSRPATPQVGDLRYNTQLSIAEIFNGVEYASLAGTGAELLAGEQVQELSSLMSLVFG